MTRLLDRIAWLIYVRAPYGWDRPNWFWRMVTNRVSDAMVKRAFQP